MAPLGATQVALAEHIAVSVQRVNELVRGKRGVTPDAAWLLDARARSLRVDDRDAS